MCYPKHSEEEVSKENFSAYSTNRPNPTKLGVSDAKFYNFIFRCINSLTYVHFEASGNDKAGNVKFKLGLGADQGRKEMNQIFFKVEAHM